MAVKLREREYSLDDIWRLERQPRSMAEKYYLIEGELCVKMSPNHLHGIIASEIARILGNHVVERKLGRVSVEVGYHAEGDRRTVLMPDVAFESRARTAKRPLLTFAPYMPDLAIEVVSPSQTLEETRRKAAVHLRLGTAMVWLIDPERQCAEVWTAANGGQASCEAIEIHGELRGGAVLPGFSVALKDLFSL